VGRKRKGDETPVFSRLEVWRSERGLSAQDLADVVAEHYQTIGHLERGEHSPTLALALRIAEGLEFPLDEVFSLQPFGDRPSSEPRRGS